MIASDVLEKIHHQIDCLQAAIRYCTDDRSLIVSRIQKLQSHVSDIMKIIVKEGDRELSPEELELLYEDVSETVSH